MAPKKDIDIARDHCVQVDPNNRHSVKCKYCSKIMSGGVSRMKHHLAGTKKDVAPCTQVTDEVKEIFLNLLNANEAKKKAVNLEKVSDEGTNEQRGTSKKGMVIKQTTMNNALKDRESVIVDICRCIYGNALPFNLVRSPLFVQMLKSVGEFGKGLKPPTYHEVRVSYLKKEVDHINECMEKYKMEWKNWGCTLMCDGWTDKKSRSITNFLVNCHGATTFLKSIDTSDVIKDGQKMFELLDEVIEEIGVENVVQVVTDGASNLVSAGEKLMEKHKTIFWAPCAAHCLDLMLEDIGKLPIFYSTIQSAKKITTYIYRHQWVLALFREHSDNKELARPAVTRFATSFLTLSRIYDLKEPIRRMFTSEKWVSSSYAKKSEGKEAMEIALCDKDFWTSIKYCLKAVGPLVKVLRLVDGDSKPAMPYIYEAMDRAKEQIAKDFNNDNKRYKEVWEIIDLRWDFQLHGPLHAAALYLNPKYFYQAVLNGGPDGEVRLGLYRAIERMYPETQTQVKIDQQLEKFKKAQGLFGMAVAIGTREKKQPALWWESFGGECKELQKLAMRVLSLTCSATGCERNWSTFEHVHSKKRNRLEQQRLNDLVYVKYNLQLDLRQKIREEKGENYDPICLSDIESDDEWIAEKEDPCLPEDNSWMDIHEKFSQSEGAPSSNRKRGPRNLNVKYSRKRKGKGKVGEIDEEVEEERNLGLIDEDSLSDEE